MMNHNQLDHEWLQLVRDLMGSDVTKEEFRAYLESKRMEIENKKRS